MSKQLAAYIPPRPQGTLTPASRPGSADVPAISSTAVKPALMDHAADYDIPRLWRDRDVHGVPRSIARALTDRERAIVERRHGDLVAGCSAFTPAEQDQAIAAMSRMLTGFRMLRRDDDEAAIASLDALRHVLAPFPLWAIEAGCLAISRRKAAVDGKPLDDRFPPNDCQVYAVIEAIVEPYIATRDRAARLLSAPVMEPLR